MSFDAVLFEGSFLTASVISSLDIDIKEKLSPPQFFLRNLHLSSFSKDQDSSIC